MNLHVLGCAGGIGGRERLTTCMKIDDDIVIDAGTGICSLGVDELSAIDHVFLTHFHLDHVAGLALLVDAVVVQGKRTRPIVVHSSAAVIASLKKHLFNWELWPDFAVIPDPLNPALKWAPLELQEPVDLGGRIVTPHPVNHTDGSVSYFVHGGASGFLFTGDMASTPELWKTFAAERRLSKVIVDCSFPNADARIAERSMHFCPSSLVEDIRLMPEETEFLIYHLKPGQEDQIMQELHAASGKRRFTALKCGDRFVF
ncbi:MAG TPA: 3',5'-cyclic-nucleotide phosphodiesterase [Paucimonas sp.]|nr:3',5'-cyclic-nucleotide phosphodiesterase [Paucimonas sp.]